MFRIFHVQKCLPVLLLSTFEVNIEVSIFGIFLKLVEELVDYNGFWLILMNANDTGILSLLFKSSFCNKINHKMLQ